MFTKMASVLKPVVVGDAEVSVLDYTNKELNLLERASGIQHEQYMKLTINGTLVMSDTPMEHRTNKEFARKAHGDILIGGLGLGMILMPVQGKETVTSITVLEKSADVIAAVAPQLPLLDKVRVLHADVFQWKPDMRFDCIYMDIWPYINSSVYEERKQLKRKYGHYLKPLSDSPERFNCCWAEYYAKNDIRLI